MNFTNPGATSDSLSEHPLPTTSTPTAKSPMIFISHSSKDKFYVDMIVEFLSYMGYNRDVVFCSSSDGYGLEAGDKIFSKIRDLFRNHNLFVLFFLSDHYYNSVPSLNEMGACYVLECPYLNFFLPDFSYEKVEGMIDRNGLAIRLDAAESVLTKDLTKLLSEINKFFGKTDPIPSTAIYAEKYHKAIQQALEDPDEIWLQTHPQYNVRGDWLHVHIKPQARVGRVHIEQKRKTITKAEGRNVTPSTNPGVSIQSKSNTSWEYSIGVVKHDEDDDQYRLHACYASHSTDGSNEGIHILTLTLENSARQSKWYKMPCRMDGTFSDAIKCSKPEEYTPENIINHSGTIILFRMSDAISDYLNAQADEDFALATLHTLPEFEDEPYSKYINRELPHALEKYSS